jgi:hypothetical protein
VQNGTESLVANGGISNHNIQDGSSKNGAPIETRFIDNINGQLPKIFDVVIVGGTPTCAYVGNNGKYSTYLECQSNKNSTML